jgi:hypothetical protein
MHPMRTSGDMARNAPNRSSVLLRHFKKRLHYSVSIAYKVANTIWTVPKISNTHYALAKRPPTTCRRISQYVSTKMGILLKFSYKTIFK